MTYTNGDPELGPRVDLPAGDRAPLSVAKLGLDSDSRWREASQRRLVLIWLAPACSVVLVLAILFPTGMGRTCTTCVVFNPPAVHPVIAPSNPRPAEKRRRRESIARKTAAGSSQKSQRSGLSHWTTWKLGIWNRPGTTRRQAPWHCVAPQSRIRNPLQSTARPCGQSHLSASFPSHSTNSGPVTCHSAATQSD